MTIPKTKLVGLVSSQIEYTFGCEAHRVDNINLFSAVAWEQRLMKNKNTTVSMWTKIDDDRAEYLSGGVDMSIHISGRVYSSQQAGSGQTQVNVFQLGKVDSYYSYYASKYGHYKCHYNYYGH
jgi:hypothetical protein